MIAGIKLMNDDEVSLEAIIILLESFNTSLR